MDGSVQQLAITLHDEIEGKSITPENIDLLTLTQFLQEATKLIQGDAKKSDMGHPEVSFEEGSFKLITGVPVIIAEAFTADIAKLKETADLDSIDETRASVIETWQRRAQKPGSARWYSIPNPNEPEQADWLRVDKKAHFDRLSKDRWIHFEEYARGTVLHMGGATPNIHLVVPSGTLIIAAAQEKLQGAGYCYENMNVRYEGLRNLVTGELKDLQLIDAQKAPVAIDAKVMKEFIAATTTAWSDVEDVPRWLDRVRGY